MNCPECSHLNASHNGSRAKPIPTTVPMTWIPWLKAWKCSWCGLELTPGTVWAAPATSPRSNHAGQRKGGHRSATA